MPLIVESVRDTFGVFRFTFRAPLEYALDLYPGPSFTGLERINLWHDGQVVAAYTGRDEHARKMPKVQLTGSEDQHDLARCLDAIKGYVFDRWFKEQTSGRETGLVSNLWTLIKNSEYDRLVLKNGLAEKSKIQKMAGRP